MKSCPKCLSPQVRCESCGYVFFLADRDAPARQEEMLEDIDRNAEFVAAMIKTALLALTIAAILHLLWRTL